jgi:hydroxylamine reductase (hybrid-cluster protein)
VAFLAEAQEMRDRAKALYEKAVAGKPEANTRLTGPAEMDLRALQGHVDKLETIGHMVGVNHRKEIAGNIDSWSLGELLIYGLKGTAAYADHARILGKESDHVYAFIHEAMAALADLPNQSTEKLLGMALRCGEINLEVMELLDAGSTGRYGHPSPSEVRTTPVKGKCIAVSGHDLRDLEEVLKRTAGKGINVYTYVCHLLLGKGGVRRTMNMSSSLIYQCFPNFLSSQQPWRASSRFWLPQAPGDVPSPCRELWRSVAGTKSRIQPLPGTSFLLCFCLVLSL